MPRVAAARLLEIALNPPAEAMRIPFTANMESPVESWVPLLMRPVVVPEVVGFTPEKSYEVRFFAPGSMACNLDFVESIFGNGGDPSLPENDAALDPEHWTGHEVFITSAGYVGPKYQVDHDISLLVPELWARMRPDEIDPRFLIDNNYLEPLKDFDYKGERLLASLCHNPQAAAHGG